MAKLKKLYEKTRNNPKDVRYEDACRLAEAFGFVRKGQEGSHLAFTRDDIRASLNFQNDDGKAKPYQVRQMLKLIDEHDLKMNEKDG